MGGNHTAISGTSSPTPRRPLRPNHRRLRPPNHRRPSPPTPRPLRHHYRRLHSHQHHHLPRASQSAIPRRARIRLPPRCKLVSQPGRFRGSRSPPTRTSLDGPRPGQSRRHPRRRPIRSHPWSHLRIRRPRCTWNRCRRRRRSRHGRPLSYLMSSPRPMRLPLRPRRARHRPLPTLQGRRNPLCPSLRPPGGFARHAPRLRNSLG